MSKRKKEEVEVIEYFTIEVALDNDWVEFDVEDDKG